MSAIQINQPYSLAERISEGGHSIWLKNQTLLQLKKGDAIIGEFDLTTEKIALTVVGRDLYFQPPIEDNLNWIVKTNITNELELAVNFYFTGPTGNGHFSLICGVGADDMRSGRMVQAFSLDGLTVNLSIQNKELIVELS